MLVPLPLHAERMNTWLKSDDAARGIKVATAILAILCSAVGPDIAADHGTSSPLVSTDLRTQVHRTVGMSVPRSFTRANMMRSGTVQRLKRLPGNGSDGSKEILQAHRPPILTTSVSVTPSSAAEPGVANRYRKKQFPADMKKSVGHSILGDRDPESEELTCLAQNIYFEARGEPLEGRLAVAHVVMNRVASARFPNTICGVVRQGGYAVRHRCQFSWWCDGKSETITNRGAWLESLELAQRVYRGRSVDPTGNALWYHAAYVSPNWRKDFIEGPKIGRHIFYRERTSVASVVPIASNQSIN